MSEFYPEEMESADLAFCAEEEMEYAREEEMDNTDRDEQWQWGPDDSADDYREDSGYQYYQNPRGRCEDAPCCGCCGYH